MFSGLLDLLSYSGQLRFPPHSLQYETSDPVSIGREVRKMFFYSNYELKFDRILILNV